MGDGASLLTFGLSVFGAFILILSALALPQGGVSSGDINRLRKRVSEIGQEGAEGTPVFLLRERYRSTLGWLDRVVIKLPSIELYLDYTDYLKSLHRIRNGLILSVILASVMGYLIWHATYSLMGVIGEAALFLSSPVIWLRFRAQQRLQAFEEQLPEALDAITRALKAGYPMTDTLHLVATEMEAPLGAEFQILFDEINGGVDIRSAFLALLERVPSISLMAFTTSVMLQRETGGNLSETLSKISQIIRKRFTFQRTIKTLTAEARLSAWVLAMLPVGLFFIILIVNPEYALLLINDPTGQKMTLAGLGMMTIGSLWIRSMIKLDI